MYYAENIKNFYFLHKYDDKLFQIFLENKISSNLDCLKIKPRDEKQ